MTIKIEIDIHIGYLHVVLRISSFESRFWIMRNQQKAFGVLHVPTNTYHDFLCLMNGGQKPVWPSSYYWFPSKEQKDHFLFITGHQPKK